MFSATIVQCLIAFFAYADAFNLHRNTRYCNNYPVALSASNIKEDLSEDSESNDNINDDLDWRAFRAQLVRSEQNGPIDPNSQDSSHWAYDSGDLIERGSVVISIPSSDPIANDIDALNNQCYRKSIVLVLDVKPDFIQGIILNRPTNVRVVEGMKLVRPEEEEACGDGGSSSRWKVWFGGEALGLYSDFPKVMCLHSVQTGLALDVSEVVLPGIFMTSFAGAEAIVKAGDAKPSDFWLFCGICGWETTSFYREMHKEGLWRIVSSDGGTILEELNLQRCEEEEEAAQEICDVDSDSRNAGIHTWEMLMDMIGRGAEACESADSFGDLMLREWATGVLSFTLNGGQSNMISEWPMISDEQNDIDSDGSDFDISQYDPASSMTASGVETLQRQPKRKDGAAGTLIRASSASRSPFLLSDQGYHKSLILILRDDDECSEGVILNHVTDSSLALDLGGERIVELPVRYGGPVQESGEDEMLPLTFLHSNKQVAEAGFGEPVGHGLFRCTEDDTILALSMGFSPNTFMVIQGFSVWKKYRDDDEVLGGVLGDVEEGFFEPVSLNLVKSIWDILLAQKKLSSSTAQENLSLTQQSWHLAGNAAVDNGEDRIQVFGTDQDVSALADEALRRWVEAYLIDE